MNYRDFRMMLDGFENAASEQGLDLNKVEVIVSLNVDYVLGKNEAGNRIFGKTEDWSFDRLNQQLVIRAEYESDSDGIRIVKDKED